MANVSSGLCECGCGEPTWLATVTNRKYGWVKGQPVRFIRGHNAAKGPGVSYNATHKYLNRHYPRTGTCEQCGTTGRTHYALTHGRQHSHDRDDYRELCVPCHGQYDRGGERSSNVKLTEAAVRDIRARCGGSPPRGTLTRLAEEYGVTISAISGVFHRKSWKGVMP